MIASDHYAHVDMLKMNGRVSSHTPLYIINGGISDEIKWNGEFHQLDTYTTLLDILSIDQPWLGLGHTLLTSSYNNSVNTETTTISEMIIEGNFFAKTNYYNN